MSVHREHTGNCAALAHKIMFSYDFLCIIFSGDVRKQRFLERFTVECAACDTHSDASSSCPSVDVPQFLPFLQLLQAENKEVRLSKYSQVPILKPASAIEATWNNLSHSG